MPAQRLAVFEFNWGPSGFIPTSGHFNFAGIYFADRATPFDPIAPFGLVGSPADTLARGTESSTYMLCGNGYCGYIPEPSTITLFGLGFASLVATRLRRRSTSNPLV